MLQNELNSDVFVLLPTFKPVLQQIRLWQVALTLTSDWIKLRGSYVTCCKTSLPWAGKRATCQILLQKVKLLSTFCNNLICCKAGWNMGGKTRNVVFQLVLQQCCKTSCRCLFPVLPYLECNLVCAFFFNRAACFFHFCSTEQSVCGCLEPENDSIWKTGRNRYIRKKNSS